MSSKMSSRVVQTEENTSTMRERLLELQRTLLHEDYSQDNMFHGIIFENMVEDVIERDGNKPMKSVSGATSTMIKEIHRKPISAAIVKLPSLESSGLIKTADTIVEFYHGNKFLEATDTSIKLKVVFDGVPKCGQFTRQAVSKGTDEFYLENLDNYYVCLTPGKDPQLISLTQDDIKARGSKVANKITIFKTTKTQGCSNIALFFCVKEKSKILNYYLVPQDNNSVEIEKVNVTRMNDDEIIEKHHKYLLFSTEYLNPDDDDDNDTDDHQDVSKLQLDTASQMSMDSVTPPTIIPVSGSSSTGSYYSSSSSAENGMK